MYVLHFELVWLRHAERGGKRHAHAPVAEPAGFTLTRFTIGTSLNICVLITTSTCVTSYLLLCMCPQHPGVLHILLYRLLSQHRSPGLCLSHARRYSERHRCVCACACLCVSVRVCVCVHMYSLSVCLSQAALSACSSFISTVRSIYLSSSCYISSRYLYYNVSLYRHMCAVKTTEHMVHCDDLVYLAS
jgi:hypothetical protein